MKTTETKIMTARELDALYSRNMNKRVYESLVLARYKDISVLFSQIKRLHCKQFAIEDQQDGTSLIEFDTNQVGFGIFLVLRYLKRDLEKQNATPGFFIRAKSFFGQVIF